MEHGVMKDVPEKDCPIHGKPMRRSGLVYYCDLCRDNVPVLPPSNGKHVRQSLPPRNGDEIMTIKEAMRVVYLIVVETETGRLAYKRIEDELNLLRALKNEA